MSDQRNLILAIALSAIVFVTWMLIFPPAPPPTRNDQPAAQSTTVTTTVPGPAAPAAPVPRAQAVAQSPRIKIDAPRVEGSINLTGARLDDLRLKDYRATIDPKSEMIVLLSPEGTAGAYYTDFGWTGSNIALPNAATVWQVEAGSVLSAQSPVTLRWDNGQGQIFRITYAIDQNFMITATQEVQNNGTGVIELGVYADISRYAAPEASTAWFLHEGFTGWLGDSLKNINWKKLAKEGGGPPLTSAGGWVGFADKYWLVSLAPPQGETFTASAQSDKASGAQHFGTVYQLQPKTIPVGGRSVTESHFFAGAKEVKTIDGYEKSLGLKRFDLAIDWGWLRFITKPIFFLLEWFRELAVSIGITKGTFGIAILLVTVCVKVLFFPLANRSYETMSKMKKLQPQLKEIQDRYKGDAPELQKRMAQLYQKEKINPLAGCLPVFLQIPVWLSLYQVLFITIEMRHAPFFGWIQDLSAKDPTSIVNLFGLLPFSAPAFLTFMSIGIWPLIMGATMVFQTSLNPPPTDPSQKIVFTWMPIVFTFMLATMPAGLVIYWTWNNTLSILQQVFIMNRLGTPPDYSNIPGVKAVQKLMRGSKPPDDKRVTVAPKQ